MRRRANMATYTADQVADTLIFLARERNIEISNLKLQKLLYYAQAWNLAIAKRPLFNEDIEAWVHGPVVPSVFRRFKSYSWNTIDEPVEPIHNKEVREHLTSVLDVYGNLGATQLERITHNEDPWKIAREGVSPDVSSNRVITHKSMSAFYTKLGNGQK
jgi:uncharacterized phage-associated protein